MNWYDDPIDGEIPDGQLTGLSLRWCIEDVIRRRVDYDRIEVIISNTACLRYEDWESHVLLPGCHTWWRAAARGRSIFDRLLHDKRIYQPLLDNDEPPIFEIGHHWRSYPF